MTFRYIMISQLLACAESAFAASTPWFSWRSKLDGNEVCAQTLPGAWELRQ